MQKLSKKAEITGKQKAVAERICNELSQRSGNKFRTIERLEKHYILCYNVDKIGGDIGEDYQKYPVKMMDGRQLGLMYVHGNLYKFYFDDMRRIKWPDDWIDPYPPFIDAIKVAADCIEVRKGKDMDLGFMCLAYYAIYVSGEYLLNKEDRMTLARFIPAVVKDFNVFLKFLNEVLSKCKIDKFEVELDPYFFDCSLKFNITDMNDEQIIENILKRTEALTELRKKFREWLPNDKRREYYESTMLFPEDPFRRRFYLPDVTPALGFSDSKFEDERRICKWPSKDPEADKRLKQKLFEGHPKYYNFDGYRLRLAVKTEKGLKFLGKADRRGWIKIDEIKREDLHREDVIIAIDKKMKKLEKFPLEKIEFLKEDFPEMFK